MKPFTKMFLAIALLLAVPALFSFSAVNQGDEILGMWLTSNGKAKVRIYRAGDQYFGKLVGGSDLYEADGKTPKKDVKNDDPSRRGRTVKDLVFLNGFKYSDGSWTDGTIYDPKNGSTYSCKMKLKGASLEIRGYIGISLFGRTEIWKRTQG